MKNRNYGALKEAHPYLGDFFLTRGLAEPDQAESVADYLKGLSEAFLEEKGILRDSFEEEMELFIKAMESLGQKQSLSTLEIRGGWGKDGASEPVESLLIRTGEVVSVVGPTGSGKSRLLEDIECLAQADTPTGRNILIDGGEPEKGRRFSLDRKMVAQISQNMNFVMDCSAYEFVKLHGESRMIRDPEETAREVVELANELAGEKFSGDTALTSLSGGQSRALMIADTACLSRSPIVLIDEIENAGVDRKRALELLVKQEKMVFLATHDPLLALMADRRIVINGGAMAKIIETEESEREALLELEKADNLLFRARETLRYGKTL
ncbi:MAG: ATP-binding cassette domain-containing protein [Spirochaetales bacterium]|nr:ATP-binding cassette domain-containing protein [Spirochaetales bacterium]